MQISTFLVLLRSFTLTLKRTGIFYMQVNMFLMSYFFLLVTVKLPER